MKINLKDKYEKKTITRKDGEQISKMILEAWDNQDKITIDFSNILIASVSFLDEAFGKLAFEYPKEDLTKKLAFKNLEQYDRALLNDILISRYHQKELRLNGASKRKMKSKTQSANLNSLLFS